MRTRQWSTMTDGRRSPLAGHGMGNFGTATSRANPSNSGRRSSRSAILPGSRENTSPFAPTAAITSESRPNWRKASSGYRTLVESLKEIAFRIDCRRLPDLSRPGVARSHRTIGDSLDQISLQSLPHEDRAQVAAVDLVFLDAVLPNIDPCDLLHKLPDVIDSCSPSLFLLDSLRHKDNAERSAATHRPRTDRRRRRTTRCSTSWWSRTTRSTNW